MTEHSLDQIDKPALAASLKAACHAAGTVNAQTGRSRTPAEIADQLRRDATSLELTGASFAKDEQFYRHVAANVREAAAFLADWQSRLDTLHHMHAKGLARQDEAARRDCAGIAREVRDMVPAGTEGERAESWRGAANTVLQAILACKTGVTS